LGVSVAPVREALVQLESEGAVVRRNNKDYHTSTLTLQQIDEIYAIRRKVETFLGEQACVTRDESAVVDVERAFENMWDEYGVEKRGVSRNYDFHFSIYRAAGMPILLEIVNSLWARIGPYLPTSLLRMREHDYAVHNGMLQAFRERDPQAFTDNLLSDLETALGTISQQMS
jgi:DNA-binding GntR family transcriptional regulator